MQFRTVRHRGLRRLLENDDPSGISVALVKRVRNILAALVVARTPQTILGPPGWRVHQLSGDRAGTWSISVSGNWRITFQVEDDEFICNLDLEDYH